MAFSGYRVASAAPELSPRSESVLKQLERRSAGTFHLEWSKKTHTPTVIEGKLSPPSKHSAQWIAYDFLTKTKPLYGLVNPAKDMKVIRVDDTADDNRRVIHLQRYLFGYPVLKNGMAIEIDVDGIIRRVEGTIHPHLERQRIRRPMFPSVSEEKAKRTVLAAMRREGMSGVITDSKLCYLPDRPGIPLVYVMEIRNETLEHTPTTFLVHAVMGHILL